MDPKGPGFGNPYTQFIDNGRSSTSLINDKSFPLYKGQAVDHLHSSTSYTLDMLPQRAQSGLHLLYVAVRKLLGIINTNQEENMQCQTLRDKEKVKIQLLTKTWLE